MNFFFFSVCHFLFILLSLSVYKLQSILKINYKLIHFLFFLKRAFWNWTGMMIFLLVMTLKKSKMMVFSFSSLFLSLSLLSFFLFLFLSFFLFLFLSLFSFSLLFPLFLSLLSFSLFLSLLSFSLLNFLSLLFKRRENYFSRTKSENGCSYWGTF